MILTTNCTLYDGVTMLSWTYDNWVDVLAIRPSSSKIHQLWHLCTSPFPWGKNSGLDEPTHY